MQFINAITFYIFYALTWLLALLPLRILYILSDITRFVLYNLLRYRRKVVMQNLKNSFPEKTEKERKSIERKFYKHLCDIFVEIIHILHANSKTAQKMSTFHNTDLVNHYFEQGQSVIVVAGHYGNWEVLNTVSIFIKHRVIAAYKPVQNRRFERFLNHNRERFGCVPVRMYDVARATMKMNQENIPFFLALFADQTPHWGEIRYWTNFMNQETPVFLGAEKLARKTNQPVLFCKIDKPRRGHYVVDFEVLTEHPAQTKPHEITELHVKALEEMIRRKPELWLWSHRRWKRQRKDWEAEKQKAAQAQKNLKELQNQAPSENINSPINPQTAPSTSTSKK